MSLLRRIPHLLLALACSLQLFAQTFNGSGGNIYDLQTVDFPLSVSGLQNSINQETFGLEKVCVNIDHGYDADITMWLVSPDGNSTQLVTGAGGDGDNFTNTCFVWNASTLIYSYGAPFTGDFRPGQNYGALNNNQNPNGTWLLRIHDNYQGDEGNVLDWSVTFGSDPARTLHFTQSNLPIVILNTNGQEIPNEPKITAQMGIIYNGEGNVNHLTDPFNNYNNKIGIELRGSSSMGFPQRSYGFETRDVNGTKHDTVLLGMPTEHDWILYAPYDDKTCMRNILSYHIANEMGHYASRTKMVELVINGSYQGIYVLMEKIKRDNNRVNIAKLNPDEIDGDDLTGGYIFKVDRDNGEGTYWSSAFPASTGSQIRMVYVEPKADQLVPQQKDYIAWYVNNFENALANVPFSDPDGYRKYADVTSFIDLMLLNEMSRNVDGYRLSTFLYKDKNSNGGKLHAGPAWDYNLGWWNADYCLGDLSAGWVYLLNDYCGGGGWDVPFWWTKLMEDPAYQSDTKCRWRELRQTTLSYTHLENFIDSVATYIDSAQQRHFQQWPIMGAYTWPNPSPIPQSYAEEIAALKLWIHQRFEWMDENLPGVCYLSVNENMLSENSVVVSPNPFTDKLMLTVDLPEGTAITYGLYDLQGKLQLHEENRMLTGNSLQINLPRENLAAGIYTLKVIANGQQFTRKVVKQ